MRGDAEAVHGRIEKIAPVHQEYDLPRSIESVAIDHAMEITKPERTNFLWRSERLLAAEQAFIGGGELLGSVKHLGRDETDEPDVVTLGAEALTTSEIESESLDRARVQSSARRQVFSGARRFVSGSEAKGRLTPPPTCHLARDMAFSAFGLASACAGSARSVFEARTENSSARRSTP